MSHELRRLLNSHEFLDEAIKEHGAVLSEDDLEGIRRERDRIFAELVNFASTQPQVTLAQIDYLLASLVDLATDKVQAGILRRACAAAAHRLLIASAGNGADEVAGATDQAPMQSVISPREARLLDSITDRAAICDGNYRYLFVNKANAAFHNLAPIDFIGRKIESVVGRTIFEQLTKPTVDRCMAGEAFSVTVGYKRRRKSVKYCAQFAPIRNDDGVVVAALVISRDVSKLQMKPQSVWRLPRDYGDDG